MTFRGEVSDEEVVDAYRRADLFVAPSRFESFGLIFVEAMMAGTPVVALDAGAAPEVIGATGAGALTAPDSASLASTLAELVGDSDRRARMSIVGPRPVRG
ncbi:MAG: glycosyltransferase family 4 protein [Microthrixaceae bacterium]